jgi:hypothetical protein
MNRPLKGFLVLCVAVLMLPACKSTRPMIKAPLKEEGPQYLYTKLKEHELQFDWLSLKFDASYAEKRKSTDFKGQIRMKKDSIIWMTITPALGIEAMRLEITNDSVKYVNRLDKNYFVGDYKLVSQFMQIDVDFDILQAIILGNDFQFYDTNTFRASIDNLDYKLSTTDRRKVRKEAQSVSDNPVVLLQNIWLDAENFKIKKIDLKEYMKDNRKLSGSYQDFLPLGSQLYPSTLKFDITADDVITIKINYNKVTINEPMTFPFSVPENYKRIQ